MRRGRNPQIITDFGKIRLMTKTAVSIFRYRSSSHGSRNSTTPVGRTLIMIMVMESIAFKKVSAYIEGTLGTFDICRDHRVGNFRGCCL
ncbi:hypothetical protein Y032_0016g2955 [Ancylostoma ceylanicum]|uniref:Uncharacterized protein n=1 Tax=Ancylostoma ceylanicum TaxID=53326 RepID=A0A016V6Z9_9BILA|nr:hypothetical protein Y032_0016g2955 [Ancylostoma ceylanicum]